MCSYQEQDLEIAKKRYEKFLSDGYPNLLQNDFINHLLLTFDENNNAFLRDSNGNYIGFNEVKVIINSLKNTVNNFSEEDFNNCYEEELKKDIIEKELILSKEEESTKLREKENNKGIVYIVRGDSGRYKIGFTKSKDINKRIQGLKSASSEKIELIHYFTSLNCSKKEKELHKIYNNKNSHNEWFYLNQKDIVLLKGLKNEY